MRYGIRLQLLLGSPVPRPASSTVVEALDRVEVICHDDAPRAFQLTFKAGRGGLGGRTDQSLLRASGLAAASRVVIVVYIGPRPSVLLDGIITHREYAPGATAGAGMVAVTGDDLTVLMDDEQRIAAYPAMSEAAIAASLIARYARHGVIARVVPPAVLDQQLPAVRIPMQHGTDLAHLRHSAARVNHVFVLRPGPVPLSSVGYWGPAAALAGRPLPPVSVAANGDADVTGARFLHDAFATVRVSGRTVDADSGRVVPVVAAPPVLSALASRPQPARRTVLPDGGGGLGASVAIGRAQAAADASAQAAVVAEGEVDTGTYGTVLEPHRLIGVRGAGRSFDGLYRIRRVTHLLERGSYRQRFQLARPGTETTTPVV